VFDALIAVMTGPTDNSNYFVPLAEQKLGQIRPVLPGDAGDQGLRHDRAYAEVVSCSYAH